MTAECDKLELATSDDLKHIMLVHTANMQKVGDCFDRHRNLSNAVKESR